MRKRVLLAVVAAAATGLMVAPLTASASSHREAPLIAEDPLADNTDLYAFVAPDDPNRTVIVANYVPFENPAGGPNFYRFGDDVAYQIHIDNRGDARDHLVFTFQFHTSTVDASTFLYNTGPIGFNNATKTYTNWNRPQTYSVTMTNVDTGSSAVIGSNLLTPPDVVGDRSTGSAQNYHMLAKKAEYTLPGGLKVFAGQRDDRRRGLPGGHERAHHCAVRAEWHADRQRRPRHRGLVDGQPQCHHGAQRQWHQDRVG